MGMGMGLGYEIKRRVHRVVVYGLNVPSLCVNLLIVWLLLFG